MTKYSCTMTIGSYIYYATVIAEDPEKAREMAVAEVKQGRPRDWSARVIDAEAEGPARALASGSREA